MPLTKLCNENICLLQRTLINVQISYLEKKNQIFETLLRFIQNSNEFLACMSVIGTSWQ
eukprot:c54745_g1_i1 orf=65-241(-)